jgi:hypothetical protein
VVDTLSLNPVFGATYQWYVNNTIINGATGTVITATINGRYKVVVSNANGCADSTTIRYAKIGLSSSIAGGKLIALKPNPAHDHLVVTLSDAKVLPYQISNNIGQVILSGELYGINSEVAVSNLANGVYWIKIEGYKTQRFIKE